MLRTRVIPVLLLKGLGLVKGVKFKDHRYLGDPMNAIKIFNESEADELILLDIIAGSENRAINADLVEHVVSEARMPISVGGGIRDLQTARNLLAAGAEKLVLNSALFDDLKLIGAITEIFGAQAVTACIDAKKGWLGGYSVYSQCGTRNQKLAPEKWAQQVEKMGAGEIVINNIDHDGTGLGYDLELIKAVADVVSIPVVAGSGSADIKDFFKAKSAGASAVAAGSQFVFQGPRRAVLISFPGRSELDAGFQETHG